LHRAFTTTTTFATWLEAQRRLAVENFHTQHADALLCVDIVSAVEGAAGKPDRLRLASMRLTAQIEWLRARLADPAKNKMMAQAQNPEEAVQKSIQSCAAPTHTLSIQVEGAGSGSPGCTDGPGPASRRQMELKKLIGYAKYIDGAA
jgi:hypothetical protein